MHSLESISMNDLEIYTFVFPFIFTYLVHLFIVYLFPERILVYVNTKCLLLVNGQNFKWNVSCLYLSNPHSLRTDEVLRLKEAYLWSWVSSCYMISKSILRKYRQFDRIAIMTESTLVFRNKKRLKSNTTWKSRSSIFSRSWNSVFSFAGAKQSVPCERISTQ